MSSDSKKLQKNSRQPSSLETQAQSSDPDVRKVKCPQCGRLTVYSSQNLFRPFCSERCRLIDLGQWADESYRVPVEDQTPGTSVSPDDFDDDQMQ